MQCPHCLIHFHENWQGTNLVWGGQVIQGWMVRLGRCPGCGGQIIDLLTGSGDWHRVYPLGSGRAPAPPEVPTHIASDYAEACSVLPFSPKASAALSRRCLQSILHEHGYRDRDLAREINLLLNETDSTKAIPSGLRTTIDAIRNFGNFSAHPITEITSLQVIDVDPEEAEWCLDILEQMFDHFYVQPARATARKANLDAKLQAAGKPPAR